MKTVLVGSNKKGSNKNNSNNNNNNHKTHRVLAKEWKSDAAPLF